MNRSYPNTTNGMPISTAMNQVLQVRRQDKRVELNVLLEDAMNSMTVSGSTCELTLKEVHPWDLFYTSRIFEKAIRLLKCLAQVLLSIMKEGK